MGGARFGSKQRLLTAHAYSAVFDASELRVSTPDLLVLARSNHLSEARLGLVVSKKNCRLATGRNRIKRLIRESFRLHQQSLAGLDIVVLSRRGLSERDNGSVTEQLDKLWSRLLKQTRKADQAPAC